MNLSIKSNQSLIIVCLAIACLITAGLYVPYFNLVALLVVTWGIVKFSNEDILCILCFVLSFSPIFKLQIGGFTFFNIVLMIAVLLGLIKKRFILPYKLGALILVFGLYEFVMSFSINVIECITVIVVFLLMALLYNPQQYQYNLRKINTFTIWGIIITSFLALFDDVIPRIGYLTAQTTIRLSAGEYYYRFSGLMENPNYYTIMLSIVLAILCILMIQGKAKILDYIFFVVLSIFGFMSVSQSFIVTFIVMVVLLMIFYAKTNPKNLLGIIAILLIMGYVIYMSLDNSTIETILFRTENVDLYSSDVSEITSGRTELWLYYLNYLSSNLGVLIFGRGIGASNLSLGASHSYYIDMLYYLGIIGTIIYLLLLIELFGTAKFRSNRVKAYQYLPWAILGIRAMARNLIVSEQLVFMLFLCSVAVLDTNNESYGLVYKEKE